MTTLTLNNIQNAQNLVCFNSTPIVVNVENDEGTSSNPYATLTISLANATVSSGDTITINGHTVTATDKLERVGNRYFYTGTDKNYNAITLINALRTIGELDVNYTFQFQEEGTVIMKAKERMKAYNIDVKTSNDTIQTAISNSTYTEELIGENSSRVFLDIYTTKEGKQSPIKGSTSQYKYLTTLSKDFYKKDVSFNISPVLNAVSTYSDTVGFKVNAYATVDDKYKSIGTLSNNFIANGYLVNQGGTYIDFNNAQTTYLAMNVERGTDRSHYNNSKLYVYDNKIVFSIYRTQGLNEITLYINYLESDETPINQMAIPYYIAFNDDKNLQTIEIDLVESLLRDSYYIDIELPIGTLRYDVINPPYANVNNNRIYWYNSYGGVSFFDFTAEQSDERKYNYETYNKTILNYYKDDKSEQAIVYARNNEITVSLDSHLIEEDGLYQLYDLANSYKAWIEVNGKNYYIIITSLVVNEPSDNVYSATVKYKYSLADSFV